MQVPANISALFRRHLLPVYGCVLFALLYFIATLYYPGGTYLDKSSPGFSWAQNYWCNLLSETAINGQYNPARPIAFAAMAVLCAAMALFWYLFPLAAGFKAKHRYLLQASGILSMCVSVFIFTSLHDIIIDVAGILGLVALIGTIAGLRRLKWTGLFYMGMFALVLVALNNLCYYKKDLMYYLPVVQKVTFVYFLLWVCCISLRWKPVPSSPGASMQ